MKKRKKLFFIIITLLTTAITAISIFAAYFTVNFNEDYILDYFKKNKEDFEAINECMRKLQNELNVINITVDNNIEITVLDNNNEYLSLDKNTFSKSEKKCLKKYFQPLVLWMMYL